MLIFQPLNHWRGVVKPLPVVHFNGGHFLCTRFAGNHLQGFLVAINQPVRYFFVPHIGFKFARKIGDVRFVDRVLLAHKIGHLIVLLLL